MPLEMRLITSRALSIVRASGRKMFAIRFLVTSLALILAGCNGSEIGLAESDDTLLRFGDNVVRLAHVQAEIDAIPPAVRLRYTSPQARRLYVQEWVNNEILAHEARRLGYDRDPEVVLAAKRAMIIKLLKERIGTEATSGEITEAEIEKYYREHLDEFSRPNEARITQIVVKSRDQALAVLDEAERVRANAGKRSPKGWPSVDLTEFRKLVFKYSEDADSKARGGDVSVPAEPDKNLPRRFVEAAFALQEIGDLSEVVETETGFHILKLREHISGTKSNLPEARARIIRRLTEQNRDRKINELVAGLSKEMKVMVFHDRLARLRFDGSQEASPWPLVRGYRIGPGE